MSARPKIPVAPVHAVEHAKSTAWTIADAEELYRIDAWGDGFFAINRQGHLAVRTSPDQVPPIDIYEVVKDLRNRRIDFPVVLRFQDVLKARVVRLNEAFIQAIRESGYQNRYQGVYPIKVNQLHEVVQEVLDAGKPYGMGLECGSKAELIAALAHLESDATPLICNGYKDAVMLRLILAGQQIGKNVIPVIEKYAEFENFLRLARETLVRPRFGVRVKLGTGGAGKWADSGGDKSKFGISVPELVMLIERLKQEQLTDAFVLLHFHLGSQLSNIQTLKQAVKEITQVYAQLRDREIPVRYIDVGGGLGVNYDAGYTHNEDGAINYTLQEYANAVVYTVMEVCDEQEVAHPILVSESGRALTAHHSVLIVESLGSSHKDLILNEFSPTDEDHTVVHELYSSLQQVQATDLDNAPISVLLEAYHDAVEKRHEAELHFVLGYLSIEQKALAERLYWTICTALDQRVQRLDPDEVELPAELLGLDDHLVQQYLCDFSIFQSILDHWAIGQGFPIMPIHHLHEEPRQRALLVDLTCDSDGKVSHYVSSEEDKSFLRLHDINGGEPYFIGFFLMGAYQDIMGDSHNLFGRVSEAHVYADPEEPNGYYIEKIIRGTTVRDMLEQVQYFSHDLHRRMNELIRQKIDSGMIRPKAGVELLNQYDAAFGESTYYNARDN